MNRMIRWLARFLQASKPLLIAGTLLFLMGASGTHCLAHPGNIAAALAKVQPDGTYQVRLRFDLLAYILGEPANRISDGPMNALLDGPPAELDSRIAKAKERFRQSFHVGNSGPEAIDTLTFPNAADVLQSVKGVQTRLPVMGSVVVTGHLPPETRTIAFQFDEAFGTVVLTTEFPYQEPISEPIEAGALSEAHRIPSLEDVTQAAVALQIPAVTKAISASPSPAPERKAPQPPPVKHEVAKQRVLPTPLIASPSAKLEMKRVPPSPVKPRPATASPSPVPSPMTVASPKPVAMPSPLPSPENRREELSSSRWRMHVVPYIQMGYTHILPEGTDHILFILGLFLLNTQVKALVKQVTAFTVAHSLTLALSLYGVIHLPASFVEPAIAASIAFVAVENLFIKEMKAGRLAVVFGFGLIHGLGFSAALQDLGLQRNNLMTALLGFNVGVELGQLTVVALAFLFVAKFRNHPSYRKFVVIPGSIIIAATAVFWMVQRIFF